MSNQYEETISDLKRLLAHVQHPGDLDSIGEAIRCVRAIEAIEKMAESGVEIKLWCHIGGVEAYSVLCGYAGVPVNATDLLDGIEAAAKQIEGAA